MKLDDISEEEFNHKYCACGRVLFSHRDKYLNDFSLDLLWLSPKLKSVLDAHKYKYFSDIETKDQLSPGQMMHVLPELGLVTCTELHTTVAAVNRWRKDNA